MRNAIHSSLKRCGCSPSLCFHASVRRPGIVHQWVDRTTRFRVTSCGCSTRHGVSSGFARRDLPTGSALGCTASRFSRRHGRAAPGSCGCRIVLVLSISHAARNTSIHIRCTLECGRRPRLIRRPHWRTPRTTSTRARGNDGASIPQGPALRTALLQPCLGSRNRRLAFARLPPAPRRRRY